MEASMELYMYAQSLADARRERPMDDIVTTLITAELDGEQLSDIEFNVFVLLLAVAGNETTRNLISGGMLALMEHPEQKRGSSPTSPAPSTRSSTRCSGTSARSCTSGARSSPTPSCAACRSQAGQKITVWYGAANRDEDVFTDPHALRRDALARTSTSRSVAGARTTASGTALAKMEIKMMFEEMLTQAPDMRLAGEPDRLALEPHQRHQAPAGHAALSRSPPPVAPGGSRLPPPRENVFYFAGPRLPAARRGV